MDASRVRVSFNAPLDHPSSLFDLVFYSDIPYFLAWSVMHFKKCFKKILSSIFSCFQWYSQSIFICSFEGNIIHFLYDWFLFGFLFSLVWVFKKYLSLFSLLLSVSCLCLCLFVYPILVIFRRICGLQLWKEFLHSEEVCLEDHFPQIRMLDSEGVKLEAALQFGVSFSVPVYSLCVLPETSAYLPLAESINLFKYLIFFGQW